MSYRQQEFPFFPRFPGLRGWGTGGGQELGSGEGWRREGEGKGRDEELGRGDWRVRVWEEGGGEGLREGRRKEVKG